MPKFDFPLDGVLRQRTHVEQQRQRELAQLQQQFRQQEDALRTLDQSMQASVNDVRENRLVGKLDLGFLAAHRRFLAAIQRQGTDMAQKMVLLQRQINGAQKVLAEAAKQRKIIEKLREKKKAAWAAELSRKESAEMDEVNTRLSAWESVIEADSTEEKSHNSTIVE